MLTYDRGVAPVGPCFMDRPSLIFPPAALLQIFPASHCKAKPSRSHTLPTLPHPL